MMNIDAPRKVGLHNIINKNDERELAKPDP